MSEDGIKCLSILNWKNSLFKLKNLNEWQTLFGLLAKLAKGEEKRLYKSQNQKSKTIVILDLIFFRLM